MMAARIDMEKNKKNRSFSFTLSISFISLIVASLLISGTMGTFFSFRAQQSIVFSQQQLIAQNASNTVTGFIQGKFSALETTARLVNPAVTSQKEQDRILNYLLGPHPAFRQLVLLNSKKQKSAEVSRLSRVGSNELYDRFGSDLFSQALQGKRYISAVYVDKVTSEPMIIIAVPVKDVFGDFRGVLIAEVNLKFMWDLVDSLKVCKTGLAYVVDRQGKLIAFGDIARVLRGENAGNVKVVHEFINNPATVDAAEAKVFTGINGATVLGTYVSLGMPDWAVVTELPVAEAYHQVIQTIVTTVIFALVMAMLAGWTGIYLSRRLDAPIVKLMETATRIAGGETGLKAEVSGPSEISALAEAFNSMTAQLRDVIGSLEQRSRHLQSTVQTYVAYMAGVGNGKLGSRLELKEEEDQSDDPLIILGQQLNETTASLQQLVEQIQDTTTNLRKREAELNQEIAERKQAEARLNSYSEELVEINDDLKSFAYIVSHDLRAPLVNIKGFSDELVHSIKELSPLLEKYLSGLAQTEQQKFSEVVQKDIPEALDFIGSSVKRMDNLINAVLKLSRAGRRKLDPEPLHTGDFVRRILNTLKHQIESCNITVTVGDLPGIVADKTTMEQIFGNLLDNAIKYLEPGRPGVIAVSAERTEREVVFHVRDNGRGIAREDIPKAFEIFRRVGRQDVPGEGMGLAYVKTLVRFLGGRIWCESEPGVGTTFSFSLPVPVDDPGDHVPAGGQS